MISSEQTGRKKKMEKKINNQIFDDRMEKLEPPLHISSNSSGRSDHKKKSRKWKLVKKLNQFKISQIDDMKKNPSNVYRKKKQFN